jgi:ATP-dependent Clp protease ATP-binding subunit ClpC
VLAEKMLYGDIGPGEIVLVDVDGEGPAAQFTFTGQKRSVVPDVPPLEGATVSDIELPDQDEPTNIEKPKPDSE